MKGNLCIIPARGGSKRIPKKNIKDFLGKPIISYILETVRSANIFDEVMVSTDDQEIKDIVNSLGAKTPFLRSASTSNDLAPTISVVNEVLDFYADQNLRFKNIFIIYPTAVFTTTEMILDGFDLLSSFESVTPVAQFNPSIWRGFRIIDNQLKFIWPDNEFIRTQDLEANYYDVGQWYWMQNIEKPHCSLIKPNAGAYIIESSTAQDIDTLNDWNIAEEKYKRLFKNV